MENLRLRPLFTEAFDTADAFRPEGPAVYFYSASPEERSRHVEAMAARTPDCAFVELQQVGDYEVRAPDGETFGLRSQRALAALVTRYPGATLYLDLTGMSHSLWAPLVRAALASLAQVRAVYLEPRSYAHSQSPREGELFDLSEARQGIGPLPTFASLGEASADSVCLIPLLGFEGSRLAYIIEQVQPRQDRIVPIVGMPGFRPEYPFHAYHANGRTLLECGAYRDVRPARANCPFSCFYALSDIMAERKGLHFKIATIGTKPHALGAVLRALTANHTPVELVYDHVRRKPNRTSGTDHCLVYDLSAFLDSLDPAV